MIRVVSSVVESCIAGGRLVRVRHHAPVLVMALVMTLAPVRALAKSQLDATLGVGIGKNVIGQEPFERFGMLGVRWGDAWKVQANGGYYFALPAGEKSSFVTSLQTGLEIVGQGGLYALFMFGPAYLACPDGVKLSGHLQFHLTGGVGVKNAQNYGLGLLWNHFSNAGIEQPNQGRDMITLLVTIPLKSFQ